jgi:hypothetical protein
VAENVAAAGLELSPDEVPRSPRTPDAGIPGFTGGDMEPIETIAWHEIAALYTAAAGRGSP